MGVNYALDELGVADKVTDAGAWVGSALYDGAVNAVEFGGEMLDIGRDVWDARDDIAEEAKDIGSGLVAAGKGAFEDAVGFVDGFRAPWD
jgi:hypothetical protein